MDKRVRRQFSLEYRDYIIYFSPLVKYLIQLFKIFIYYDFLVFNQYSFVTRGLFVKKIHTKKGCDNNFADAYFFSKSDQNNHQVRFQWKSRESGKKIKGTVLKYFLIDILSVLYSCWVNFCDAIPRCAKQKNLTNRFKPVYLSDLNSYFFHEKRI